MSRACPVCNHFLRERCSLAKTHTREIRKALAVIRRSKTSRKQVSVKWVVGRDSTFLSCFWTLTFSGESAAEYAANSGILRKRRPSSPPIFGRRGEKPPPIPKWEGRREASSSPPVFSRASRDNFFRENLLKKNEVQRRKNYRKWCQNDQEGLQYDQEFLKRLENLMC